MNGIPLFLSRYARKPVLYVRSDPDHLPLFGADLQESMLFSYCRERNIPVLGTIRVECGGETSLAGLTELLDQLPPDCDSLLAARFYVYSNSLSELSDLCRLYMDRGKELYSLEHLRPIRFLLGYYTKDP